MQPCLFLQQLAVQENHKFILFTQRILCYVQKIFMYKNIYVQKIFVHRKHYYSPPPPFSHLSFNKHVNASQVTYHCMWATNTQFLLTCSSQGNFLTTSTHCFATKQAFNNYKTKKDRFWEVLFQSMKMKGGEGGQLTLGSTERRTPSRR